MNTEREAEIRREIVDNFPITAQDCRDLLRALDEARAKSSNAVKAIGRWCRDEDTDPPIEFICQTLLPILAPELNGELPPSETT